MPRVRSILSALALLVGGALPDQAAPVDYLGEVKPLLTRHCVNCHGEDHPKGNLRLDTAASALRGGEEGPAWIPGDADRSRVIEVIEGRHATVSRMPYKKPPLDPADIATLRRWIVEGASAPASEAPGRYVHWAFIPPRRSTLPPLSNSKRARNGIDLFIQARLESLHIAPSPEADRATLLRRLSLDLVGLPPTPEQVDAFVADLRPGAYERQVDELLRSPHHGERWARWWLDVARYADSNGYSIDAPRVMWPWRDWVIQAFNDNRPFDQFVIEQLAGDLLPSATLPQRVATGFHRNTQVNQEGGIDPEQFRIESVLDRVNTTGSALMGITLACAQCHDHKFDPFTQHDYFQVFALFNDQDEPTLPVPTPADQQALADHAAEIARLESSLAALHESDEPSAKASRDKLATHLDRLKKKAPQVTTTLVLAERAQPRPSYIFIKGDFTRRGADVQPGLPAVLDLGLRTTHPPAASRRLDRLDFARWLTRPDHPLTARVLVNRVWQQYFGRGLVETENDFGTQGTPPSHPELLDWLAREFADSGWDLKALHRLITTSATYRQSARVRADLAEKDPGNRWLARQNRLRLDAEIIRDVALAASGVLDPTIGGPPVFPPQPDGVMNLGQSRRDWTPSQGSDRYRRGLYTFYWRATPHPALAVFDAPDAFSACTRRLRSNTPLQALTLLNDTAFVELAEALAQRLQRQGPDSDRITTAFRLCLSRPPKPAEHRRLKSVVDEERRLHGESAAWSTLARVLLNLDETITRE
jgi:mono/diheme cytochrome c family protein